MRVTDSQVVGNMRYLQTQSRLLAMGPRGKGYICGLSGQETTCVAYQPGVDWPVWQAALGMNGTVSGGALVPGRLYVTTDSGMLFAIGQEGPGSQASKSASHTPAPTWTLPFLAQTLTPEP